MLLKGSHFITIFLLRTIRYCLKFTFILRIFLIIILLRIWDWRRCGIRSFYIITFIGNIIIFIILLRLRVNLGKGGIVGGLLRLLRDILILLRWIIRDILLLLLLLLLNAFYKIVFFGTWLFEELLLIYEIHIVAYLLARLLESLCLSGNDSINAFLLRIQPVLICVVLETFGVGNIRQITRFQFFQFHYLIV